MNADYQALIATGLPFRIASQNNGRARVYVGNHSVSFFDNRRNSAKLTALAPNVKRNTHQGRAMAALVEDLEAIRRELSRVEREALSQAIQAAPSRKALAL